MISKTLKIQVIPNSTTNEEFKEYYNKVRDLSRMCSKASNQLISYYWNLYLQADRLHIDDKEKFGLINKITNKPFTGKTLFSKYNLNVEKQNTYSLIKNYIDESYLKGNSHMISALSQFNYKKFLDDISDIAYGKKSLPNFKQDMAIPIGLSHDKVTGENYKKFGKEKFTLTKELTFSYIIKDNSTKTIVERIHSQEYKLGDSKFGIINKKFYLFVTYSFEPAKFELNPNVYVGVDLGITIPAYVSLNDKYTAKALKSEAESIQKIQFQVSKRRRLLQSSLATVSGGHGRKHKLRALETIQNKESNSVQTINHKLSKSIIDFAIENKAATIKLEDLQGIAKKANIFLKRWTYFQLQSMIQYKAKEKGITVLFIKPAYTSQTCSMCGNLEKEQRKSQNTFECLNTACNHKENADRNAARNIAFSTNFIEEK